MSTSRITNLVDLLCQSVADRCSKLNLGVGMICLAGFYASWRLLLWLVTHSGKKIPNWAAFSRFFYYCDQTGGSTYLFISISIYGLGQKVSLGFSITSYRKTQMIFLANLVSVVLYNNPWIIQYGLRVNIQFLLSMSWYKMKKQHQ